MSEQESIIVAIELGTSKICGIAGKLKDGGTQILAYAEDTTADCVKRGVVYNIEKTTQSISSVIRRLEEKMKKNITQVYIGIGGQSVRSIKSVVKKNLLTPSYITQQHIDEITDESHDVPYDDAMLVGSFLQDFVIDSNTSTAPVGVMGTNIEGAFLNVIANRRLRNNIDTCCANLKLQVADHRLAATDLATNLLTDTEKRSGCALVDFGAGTTTLTVLKNNIVRQVVTIPLGTNNLRQDLCDLQIEEAEANHLLLTYATASVEPTTKNDNTPTPTYTTIDGRLIEVPKIQHIIEARLREIIANVKCQINNSEYADKLFGGIVLTGGGANIKDIEKVCATELGAEKVRIAKKLVPTIIKNSDITALSTESTTSVGIISLLVGAATSTEAIPCTSDDYTDPDIFSTKAKENEISAQKTANAQQQKEEQQAFDGIEMVKTQLRNAIRQMQMTYKSIEANGANKQMRATVAELIETAMDLTTEQFEKDRERLGNNEKYRQTMREVDELIRLRQQEIGRLKEMLDRKKREGSFMGRMTKWIDDMINNE